MATWAFSPIKFQADRGIPLAFMFIWNMLGALMLLPALAYCLLDKKSKQIPGTGAAVANGAELVATVAVWAEVWQRFSGAKIEKLGNSRR